MLAAAADPAAAAPCVTLPGGGTICGVADSRDGYQANEYLGIPYATAQRFENPTMVTPRDTFHADAPGSKCPQLEPTPSDPMNVAGDEDCLFLNIWTPSSATATSALPVLFFIHGGAFVFGASTSGKDGDLLYDGLELSNLGVDPKGVVVVTINYRLGALGFLVMPDATAPITGNYGFRDQIAALLWVQTYIRSFGGDPGKVTIVGQSAGATSVAYHAFSSSRSAGLFRSAFMESAPLGLPLPKAAHGTTRVSQLTVENYDPTRDCGYPQNQHRPVDAACLRNKDLISFKSLAAYGMEAYVKLARRYNSKTGKSTNLMPWGPILDGTLLVRPPLAGASDMASGQHIVLGTTRDEGAFFVDASSGNDISMDYYRNVVISLLGSFPNDLPSVYDCASDTCGPQFARLLTDYVFTCPAHALATRRPRETPVYAYQFAHVPSFGYPASADCRTEVCHNAELPFVWDSAKAAVGKCGAFTTPEQSLSDRMARLWASFVAAGDPNAVTIPGAPKWPAFDAGRRYLILDTGGFDTLPTVPQVAHCSYWDSKGYPGILPPAR